MRNISAVVALCLLAMLVGCGNSDLTFSGESAPTATPGGPTGTPGPGAATPTSTPDTTCGASGDDCGVNTDCCSGQCVSDDGVLFTCE
jgi:hypothetical protein